MQWNREVKREKNTSIYEKYNGHWLSYKEKIHITQCQDILDWYSISFFLSIFKKCVFYSNIFIIKFLLKTLAKCPPPVPPKQSTQFLAHFFLQLSYHSFFYDFLPIPSSFSSVPSYIFGWSPRRALKTTFIQKYAQGSWSWN